MIVPWATVLDEIEADLAAAEAALADRDAAVTTRVNLSVNPRVDPEERYEPDGPLPAELGPRAEILLARTRTLEARATVDRDRLGTTLAVLAGRHQPPERARTGRVVDVAG